MNEANFDPINRLVEFGLGISMAQQMVNMMNSTMQTMQVPGQTIPTNSTPKEWYVAQNGNPAGPLTEKEIKNLLLSNVLTKDDLVWSVGMQEWKPIKDVPEVLKMLIQLPPKL